LDENSFFKYYFDLDTSGAGGTVLEQHVVIDGNLITSRHPIDVADFSIAVEKWLIKNK